MEAAQVFTAEYKTRHACPSARMACARCVRMRTRMGLLPVAVSQTKVGEGTKGLWGLQFKATLHRKLGRSQQLELQGADPVTPISKNEEQCRYARLLLSGLLCSVIQGPWPRECCSLPP